MNKPELQTKILNNAKYLSMLSSAIDRLPDSETRGELIYKANIVLQRLADLQADLGVSDCYYGFVTDCPGVICCECKYLLLRGE